MTGLPPVGSPFRRDGHLSDYGLEALELGLLSPQTEAEADDHAASCDWCRGRRPACDDAAGSVPVPPPFLLPSMPAGASLGPPVSEPAPANRLRLWLSTLVAVAAVSVLVVRPSPTVPDDLRSKGTGLTVTLVADDGADGRVLGFEDAVGPDQRVGFQLDLRRPGHVIIVGIDDQLDPYLCSPQDGSGGSMPMEATDGPVELLDAVRFDGERGDERIVGLRCDEPVSVAEVYERLREEARELPADVPLPRLYSACDQQEYRLSKEVE